MILNSRIEGTGFPLIIMHGYMGLSDNWKSLSTVFASQGFQVHALDLRNHGKSFHSDVFNYAVMVQDVVDYCKEHQIEEAYFIGHSMGGKLGMFLATAHPDLVVRLVVADITPKRYAPHHQQIMEALNAVDFSVQPTRAQVQEIMSKYIHEAGVIQFLLKNLHWKEPGQLEFKFNLPVFNQNPEAIGEELPAGAQFENPTLFINGGASKYITAEDVEQIPLQFPKAQFYTIPDVGHWLHAENPKVFAEQVLQFLK